MPIYEYKCPKCGFSFEAFQRMGADGSELNCPNCSAAKPQKIFSAFASSSGDSRSNVSCATSVST
jgi:putative FmdB family regulatory protein